MNDLAITSTLDEQSVDTSTALMIMNPEAMKSLVTFADMMSKAIVSVPDHLRGKPSDCLAIVMQAAQWGMNPFAVAQKTHVISGRLGYEAQLVNAVLMESRAIVGHPKYEFRGEGQKLECRVGCTLRGDDVETWGEWYCIDQVKTKNSPLWQTNPRQQMAYLQLKYWSRLYAPGPVLGVYTIDELEEAPPAPKAGPRRRSDKPTQLVERVDGGAGQPTGGTATSNADPVTGETTPPPAGTQAGAPAQSPAPAATTSSNGTASLKANEVLYLRNKLKNQGITEQSICDRFAVPAIEHLNAQQFAELKAELIANG